MINHFVQPSKFDIPDVEPLIMIQKFQDVNAAKSLKRKICIVHPKNARVVIQGAIDYVLVWEATKRAKL